MSDIVIKEVQSAYDLNEFIKFPISLYKNEHHYVPALHRQELKLLLRKKNPAFEFCKARYWLAKTGKKIVGRIAAIFNPLHNEQWGNNLIRFGWFDFIDNSTVSAALLREVEHWGTELGCEGIHGPWGFTELDRKGFLISGFKESGTYPTTYNYEYYISHLQQLSYKKESDWVEYEIEVPDSVPDKVSRINEMVLKRSGFQLFVASKLKELRKYSEEAITLLNSSFKYIYGYTQLTPSQISFYSKLFFRYVSRRFTKLVLNEKNELIGFALSRPAMTSVLQKTKGRLYPWHILKMTRLWRKNNHLIMYFIAVKPDFQNKGIAAIILSELTKACIKSGIKTAETSAESENDMALRGMWKNFKNRQHKTRRSFVKMFK